MSTVKGTVAYDVVDSPVGPLFAAVSDLGLCMLSFDGNPDLTAEAASERLGAPARRYPEELLGLRTQLRGYFDGSLRDFDLPLDLRATTDFGRRVLEATVRVGFGDVATYGDIAKAMGEPNAARAVGQALNRNPVAIVVPCHRVVGSGGSLTGYGGGIDRKEALLALEGIRCHRRSLVLASSN